MEIRNYIPYKIWRDPEKRSIFLTQSKKECLNKAAEYIEFNEETCITLEEPRVRGIGDHGEYISLSSIEESIKREGIRKEEEIYVEVTSHICLSPKTTQRIV